MPHPSREIVCHNCGHSIQLPSAMRQKIPQLLLACPSCGHVYEYKTPQYPASLLERRDLHRLMLHSIPCECADSNCKFPVAVHTVLPAEIDARAELARHRARWVFHKVTCPFGHPLVSQLSAKIA